MVYRKEIDGLRAIAVMSVILFHAGFEWFKGGYIGVDVFFVISGYLITSLIVSERMENNFSLVKFYERRARRVLPALFFIMLVSIPCAWLLMLPYQLEDFAKSILAVCVFSSNILFWRESGYFSEATELKPLLHTWSLSIEEQFYLFFPLGLLAVWRFGLKKMAQISTVICLLSLCLAEWMAEKGIIVANFYLMPTRAWELLIGSLVALYLLRAKRTGCKLDEFGSVLGIGMIVYSVLMFDKTSSVPGLMALIPTLGTALVLIFAVQGTIINTILSTPWMVGLGLISYSAYLWHQPMFAFARLWMPSPSYRAVLFLGLILATLFLAWLTWLFVERPFRLKSAFSRRQVFSGIAVSMAVFCSLAVMGIIGQGGFNRFPEKDRKLLAVNPINLGRYTEKTFKQMRGNSFKQDAGTLRVAIIGDSLAEDLVNMIVENGYMSTAQIVTFTITAQCPKYLGGADVAALYSQHGEYYNKEYCDKNSNIAESVGLARSADVVVLAASWRKWEVERILETLLAYDLKPEKKFIIIGPKSFGAISVRSYIDLSETERIHVRNPIPANVLIANSILRDALPPTIFVDVISILCGNGATCPVFTPRGELISYDGVHFTPEGARFAGERVFEHLTLSKLK